MFFLLLIPLSTATFPGIPTTPGCAVASGLRPEYSDLIYLNVGNTSYEYSFTSQDVVRISTIAWLFNNSLPGSCSNIGSNTTCEVVWAEGWDDAWRWQSKMYYWKNERYARPNPVGGVYSGLSEIRTGWVGMPYYVDALIEESRSWNWGFNGSGAWRYNVPADQVENANLPMATYFPGIPFNVESAIRHYHTDLMLFFKNLQYWVLDFAANHTIASPRNLIPTVGTCQPVNELSSLIGFVADKYPPTAAPYQPNTDCSWRIYAPLVYFNGTQGELTDEQSEIYRATNFGGIGLSFVRFDVGDGDYLEIWQNNDRYQRGNLTHSTMNRTLLFKFSKLSPPPINITLAVSPNSKSVTFHFVSDGDTSVGDGWRARTFLIAAPGNVTALAGPGYIVSDPSVNETSFWILPQTQTPGFIDMRFFFHLFKFDYNTSRSNMTYLVVQSLPYPNGTVPPAQICGADVTNNWNVLPNAIRDMTFCNFSVWAGAKVSFYSPIGTLAAASFKYIVKTSCNGFQTINAVSGVIEDGSGDFLYYPVQTCNWYIYHTPDPESLITLLSFTAFETQNDGQGSDSVKVWDRNNTSTSFLLDTLQGEPILPKKYTSENPEMLIRFVSNGLVNLKGFSAQYTVIYQPSPNFTHISGLEGLTNATAEDGATVDFRADVGDVVHMNISAIDKFSRIVDSIYWTRSRFLFIFRIVPEALASTAGFSGLKTYQGVFGENASADQAAFPNYSPADLKSIQDFAFTQPYSQISFPSLPGDYRLYLILVGRRTNSTVFPVFNGYKQADKSYVSFRLLPAAPNSGTSSLQQSALCNTGLVNPDENPNEFELNTGTPTTLCLTIKDRFKNVLGRGQTNVRVFIIAETYAIIPSLNDSMNGYFTAIFLPKQAAIYAMTVLVSGADIPNSPFPLIVRPGSSAANMTTVMLGARTLVEGGQVIQDGLVKLAIGDTLTLMISTFDAYGNPQMHIDDTVSVNITVGGKSVFLLPLDLNLTELDTPSPPSDFPGGIMGGGRYAYNVTFKDQGVVTFAVSINGVPVINGSEITSGDDEAFARANIIDLNIQVGETAIASWHRIVGTVGLVGNILLVVISAALVVARRSVMPLKAMSTNLLLLTSLGALLFLHYPLVEVLDRDYPCGLFLWLSLLAPVLWITPILLSFIRLRILYPFSQLKKKWAKMALDVAGLVAINERKKAFSETRFLSYYAAAIAGPIIIVIAIAASFSSDVETSLGCGFIGPAEGFWAAFGTLYFILLCVGVYSVRDYEEVLGFRKEAARLVIYAFVIGLVALIIRATVNPSDVEKNDIMFIVWLIPMFYQFRGVLVPAFRTFNIWDKARQVDTSTPLSDILATKRGFDFFYSFTSQEFSQENPLCWKAMEAYRKRTSIQSLQDIYTKFLAPGSPLQVNLPMLTVLEVKSFIDAYKPDTPIEKLQNALDNAQLELLNLMTSDSYRRFLSSPLYTAFMRGERAPHDGSTVGGSTNNMTTTHSKHSKDVELTGKEISEVKGGGSYAQQKDMRVSDDTHHTRSHSDLSPARPSDDVQDSQRGLKPSSSPNVIIVEGDEDGPEERESHTKPAKGTRSGDDDDDEQERFVV